MKHGSLFSGIGGFDLAAEWMGWENVFHCEWNEFGQKVLKYYWPNAKSYNDITKSTFSVHRGTIDILTGGFPCQPFSTAGKRKGTDDNRYLWPAMLRVIREIQPRYIVGENVRGLVNWNEGMVFDQVCADLEAEGYEVLPVLLPAAGVNAPHRRDRIWFVAKNTKCNGCICGESKKAGATNGQFGNSGTGNSDGVCRTEMAGTIAHSNDKGGSDGLGQIQVTDGEVLKRNNYAEFGNSGEFITSNSNGFRQPRKKYGQEETGWLTEKSEDGNATDSQRIRLEHGKETGDIRKSQTEASGERSESSESAETNGGEWNAANSNSQVLEYKNGKGETIGRTIKKERIKSFNSSGEWEIFPTVSPVCNGDDGLSDRLDGITFPKWRNESIKAGGNAIVPQVAFQIFKAIQEYESNTNL